MPSDPDDCAIVTAILAMADALKLDVIAESVETPGQRDFLLQLAAAASRVSLITDPCPPTRWRWCSWKHPHRQAAKHCPVRDSGQITGQQSNRLDLCGGSLRKRHVRLAPPFFGVTIHHSTSLHSQGAALPRNARQVLVEYAHVSLLLLGKGNAEGVYVRTNQDLSVLRSPDDVAVAVSTLTEVIAEKGLKASVADHYTQIIDEKAGSISTIIRERIAESAILARNRLIIEAVRQGNAVYSGWDDARIEDYIGRIDRERIAHQGRTETAVAILNNHVSQIQRQYVERDPGRYGEIILTDRLDATVAMSTMLPDFYQADEY